jgi:putative membrane-bound dehydrogenase-like protein
MKSISFICFLLSILASVPLMAGPLRVVVSSDDPSFANPYAEALTKAGVLVVKSQDPDDAVLAKADVVLLHRKDFVALPVASQTALTKFASRGGGIVGVHGAVAAGDEAWGKSNLGGAWISDQSHSFKSRMMLYVVTDSHPIVKDASPFDIDDDTLYDLSLRDDIFVLASAYTPKGRDGGKGKRKPEPDVPGRDVRASIYDLQPQMWTYEAADHRAAVILPGAPATLGHASVRAFILRSVAWTGKRENIDGFCKSAETADLRYPSGGPRRAADAIKQFEMQPGFVASVVASEPLVNKPIAIQWDAAGRLWVAETPEYPNGRRPLVAPAWKETGVLEPDHYDRPARDSISYLIDTNGDGEMDEKHVFYQGLELVTAFCFHKDGVIAVSQPNMVWLRDTDGDGKADVETPLFAGFAPGDTHFVANHFIPAPDGWIYASTGSGADVRKPGTNEFIAKISPGMFRFKADGSAIQQVASQGGNSFGGEVTSDMELYHGKATSGNPVQHVVLPEWVLARAPTAKASSFASVNPGRTVARKDLPDRAPLMQIDQVGRYSAACSVAVYEGGAWPEEYNGKIFMSEPILDTIHHEAMTPNGPTFGGELVLKDEEWLRSKDYWFCPIDESFGPDGAMYVLDFYTPVVAHNDTRGPQHSKSGASVRPDRDHHFGRIYRIQHEAAKPLTIPDLNQENAAGLVKAFIHPNKVVRFNAIRILMEKSDKFGKDAVPDLTKLAKGETFIPGRIMALWALERLAALDAATFESAATSTDAAVRKNAMLIAESAKIQLTEKQATSGLSDPDARVQLATLRALGASTPAPGARSALLAATPNFDNPWSKAAAMAAGDRNGPSPLPEILADKSSKLNEDSVRSLAVSLATGGDAKQIELVLKACVKSPNPKLVTVVLVELGRHKIPTPADAEDPMGSLRSILNAGNPLLAASALSLASQWDDKHLLGDEISRVIADLTKLVADGGRPVPERSAAVRALLGSGSLSPETLASCVALLDDSPPDAFALELIKALSRTGDATVGAELTKRYPVLPSDQQEMVFGALVTRPAWSMDLLSAISSKAIRATSLAPAQISRLTSHPDPAVVKRAKEIFSSNAGSKDAVIAALLPEIEKPGDVANGKVMFAALCSSCHQLGGAGNIFGPALDGIGSHPVLELLTHIVNPNLVVDDEHRTWNLTMKDGSQYSALIGSENEARVRILQPGGITLDLTTSDIAKRVKGDNSLMPEGLEAMGAANLRDIIAYLKSTAPAPSK